MIDFARKHVLTFDCYGTLIDWETGISAALQPVLEAHGVSVPEGRLLELYVDLEAAAEAGPYRPYSEVPDLQTLAELACLSPSGFHRLFRRHTKLTATEYVAELRIGQACALLINTARPIATIADDVGYRSLANFNRQFRAAKDMTPRAFRRSFGG